MEKELTFDDMVDWVSMTIENNPKDMDVSRLIVQTIEDWKQRQLEAQMKVKMKEIREMYK